MFKLKLLYKPIPDASELESIISYIESGASVEILEAEKTENPVKSFKFCLTIRDFLENCRIYHELKLGFDK